MAELCGTILSGDIPVAEVRNGVVTVTNARLAPLYFRRSQDAGAWLSGRAIDSHRANSRLLKRRSVWRNATTSARCCRSTP